MTQVISLNSTDSLLIPTRTSSILAHGLHGEPGHRLSPVQDERNVIPSPPTIHTADTDMAARSPKRLSGTSTTSDQGGPGHGHGHQRSNSMKRKPVPSYLPDPMPTLPIALPHTDLPADHPFNAHALPSPGLSVRKAGAGTPGRNSPYDPSGSEVGTPGYREDKDLFFAPQQVQTPTQPTGLPPPRRNFKGAATKSANKSPAPSSTRSISGNVSGPTSPAVPAAAVVGSGGQEVALNGSGGLGQRRSTFHDGLNINIPITDDERRTAELDSARDRPLPPLPDNASVMSFGMASILGAGPVGVSTRSNSSESRPGPATPREGDWAPASPHVHGLDAEDKPRKGLFGGRGKSGAEKPPKPARRVSVVPLGEDEEDEVFSVDRVPSKRRLWEAGTHFVRDEEGKLVCFGDLFPRYGEDSSKPPISRTKAEVASLRSQTPQAGDRPGAGSASADGHSIDTHDPSKPPPRTVVFFIRFFWCPQCQDYTAASIAKLDPAALAKANIRVVIISNGNWKHIKPYRELFNCPFPIYVDGGRKLYTLMG